MGRIEKTVFISYRRTNFYTALAVYQDLTAHGYDVFFDYQSIDSGSFEKAILENIEARAHFVLVLSSSALERCSQPNDWLRREIETAIELKRNIVPLMMEGFDFGSSTTIEALTGKLSTLNTHNGLRLYADYFFDAMEKLRTRFLNVAIDDLRSREVSKVTREANETNKAIASEAAPVEARQLTAEEWFERGYVFQKKKNFNKAIRCYTEAIRIDSNIATIYNNRGAAHSDNRDYDKALSDFNKAVEIDPTYATAYSNLGNLLSNAYFNRYGDAEMVYRKAIELNPSDTNVYSSLCILLINSQRFDEAFYFYKKAIELDPSKTDENSYSGISLTTLIRFKEAEEEYRKSNKLN